MSAGSLDRLLVIDLDGFKQINDTLGHAAGDAVLVTLGDRLRACASPGVSACRLGGDEFAMAVNRRAAFDTEDLIRALQVPMAWGTIELSGIRASVGVVAVPRDQTLSFDEIMAEADTAMYEDKRLRGRRRGCDGAGDGAGDAGVPPRALPQQRDRGGDLVHDRGRDRDNEPDGTPDSAPDRHPVCHPEAGC